MASIEEYCPFGGRGEFTPATEAQCERMSEFELAAYEKLKTAFDSCASADRDLLDCERELHQTVAASREIEAKLAALPKLSQHDLVMQMRAVNR
jgi:hypothetical protein